MELLQLEETSAITESNLQPKATTSQSALQVLLRFCFPSGPSNDLMGSKLTKPFLFLAAQEFGDVI